MIELKTRTKDFALRVIRLCCYLPKTTESQVIGKQMLRSGTSLGAHYREATRARSTSEFVSKLNAGQQELEETNYWFELLVESGIVDQSKMVNLISEANELGAILTTCVKNARKTEIEKVNA